MTGDYSAIDISEPSPSIAFVRLIRPREKNPLSISTLAELGRALTSLTQREDINFIVFTGTDNAFASGANIRELTQLNEGFAQEFAELGQTLFRSIASARQQTIAAINGFCIGGALDLALACNHRFASSTATFAHPGARLGIITGWGGTQRLPRLVGRARALELFATARLIDAHEALAIGLVDDVADPVLQRALTQVALTFSKTKSANEISHNEKSSL